MRVYFHLSIDHWLATVFHPQADSPIECQHQMMEQYLRACCNYEQDHQVELLPLAEFAYNNSVHASMWITPFWANYNYHWTMQFKTPLKQAYLKLEVQADSMAAGLVETH
jgi:hypothetical protein